MTSERFYQVFKRAYSELNEEQKKAVDTIEGPVLVIAGPGTGKTQVLALRIVNILNKTDVDPDSILCLTFQESSVIAMQERLRRFLGYDAYKVAIHTFHSFCTDVIRKFYYLFDFTGDVEPIKDIDKLEIFKKIIQEKKLLNLQSKDDVLLNFNSIASAISTLKKEFISPDKFLENIKKYENTTDKGSAKDLRYLERLYELQKLYEEYVAIMQQKNLIDFDDMIYKVTEAFLRYDELVKFYQERFLYTLIDEFQDTNGAQLQVVKSISAFENVEANVFAVGDDDQTIFRFQGASTYNFNSFLEIFPDTEIIVLKLNYRSNQTIIDASKNVIEKNQRRLINSEMLIKRGLDKNFKSYSDFTVEDAVEIHGFEHSMHEDYWICQKIDELVKSKEQNIKYRDIAIIARTNKQLLNLTRILSRFGIPYKTRKLDSVIYDPYINNILFLFEIIGIPEKLFDDYHLWQLLSLDMFQLDYRKLLDLLSRAKRKKVKLFDFIIYSEELEVLPFKSVLEKLSFIQSYAANNNFNRVFIKTIYDLDLISYFSARQDDNLLLKISTLYQYVNSRTNFLKNYSTLEFINEMRISRKRGFDIQIDDIDDNEENRVNLITAHSSKGLEFKIVFIYQAIENKWEKIRGGNNFIKLPVVEDVDEVICRRNKSLEDWEDEIKEHDERRLFYVSMTRAKDKLFVTFSKKYPEGDAGDLDVTPKRESIFVLEMGKDILLHNELLEKHQEIIKLNIAYGDRHDESLGNLGDSLSQYLKAYIKDIPITYSLIEKFNKCKYKVLLEDIFKIPIPSNAYAVFGEAVHYGIELIYKGIFNKELVNSEDTANVLNFAIQESLKKMEERLSTIDLNDVSLDLLNRDLLVALEVYFKYLIDQKSIKTIKPLNIEKNITCYLGDIKIKGRVDLILQEDEHWRLIDFKASAPPSSLKEFLGINKGNDGAHLRQLLFYKLLIENSFLMKYNKNKELFLSVEYVDVKEHNVKVFTIPSYGDYEYLPRSNAKTKCLFSIDDAVKKLEEDIAEVRHQLNLLSFERTSNLSYCKECPFKVHCRRY